jgi:hypothetical protein
MRGKFNIGGSLKYHFTVVFHVQPFIFVSDMAPVATELVRRAPLIRVHPQTTIALLSIEALGSELCGENAW